MPISCVYYCYDSWWFLFCFHLNIVFFWSQFIESSHRLYFITSIFTNALPLLAACPKNFVFCHRVILSWSIKRMALCYHHIQNNKNAKFSTSRNCPQLRESLQIHYHINVLDPPHVLEILPCRPWIQQCVLNMTIFIELEVFYSWMTVAGNFKMCEIIYKCYRNFLSR